MTRPVPLIKAQNGLVSFSSTREREFYKYLPLSRHTVPHVNLDTCVGDLTPRTSPDSSLSAFAQLGALRLDAQRATISLFGRHEQHILTEATQSLSLRDDNDHKTLDGLWVGACTMSYDRGFCAAIASSTSSSTQSPTNAVFIVPDLTQNETYQDHPDVTGDPKIRFLAHALIVSPKGIVIGVYTILDDKPRSSLNSEEMKFLKDMAATCMDYLVTNRAKSQHIRSERMIVGLGSFLEGKGSLRSSWVDKTDGGATAGQDNKTEGSVSTQQQDKQHLGGVGLAQPRKDSQSLPFRSDQSDTPLNTKPNTLRGRASPMPRSKSNTSRDGRNRAKAYPETKHKSKKEVSVSQIEDTFGRAANIVRESLEVEGVVFFDANSGGQDAFVTNERADHDGSSSENENKAKKEYTQSDVAQSLLENSGKETLNACKILGFATSNAASVNSELTGDAKLALSESLLAGLLRRYPSGKIFNFTEDGSISSDDTSDSIFETFNSRVGKKYKKTRKSVLRHDALALLNMAPGSRSIIFSPVWDSHKSRWYAGTFAWTKTMQRVFTLDDELTFCTAFGSSVIAEVHRLGALFADQAKADLLAGLSHELRSPLHGIFGTAELLNDTIMDALQRGLVHTISSCANTLLGSINQLLEFSGINDIQKKHSLSASSDSTSLAPSENGSITRGRNTESIIHLDVAVEETLETIFAGFCFFHKSRLPLRGGTQKNGKQTGFVGLAGGVKMILDIDFASHSTFFTRPGALHVILTNMVGNALKYTQQGYVYVSVKTEPNELGENDEPLRSKMTLSVQDTGCGMDSEFLQNGYFTAFSQEDSLLPGNGLGANITQKTVSSLDGELEVRSQKDIGTQVDVILKLDNAPRHVESKKDSGDDPQNDFVVSTRRLVRHKSIGILGLGSSELDNSVSSNLQKICQEWFQMDVHLVIPSHTHFPHCDFYISPYEYLDIGNLEIKSIAPDSDAKFPSPVIIICSSPRVAHSLYLAARQRGDSDVLEFISQPCGPQKLAKSLDNCLKRQNRRFVGAATPAHSRISEFERLRSQMFPTPVEDSRKESAVTPTNHSPPMANQGHTDPAPGKSPLNQADYFSLLAPALAPPQEGKETAMNGNQPQQGPPMALLVDDNEINISLLVAFMKKLGLQYLIARNGQEALESFKENNSQVSIVLMDITMPVMDGLESSRQIRAFENVLEGHDRVPIVALTGVAQAEVEDEAISSGMNLFLTKPVRLDTIARVIKDHVGVVEPLPKGNGNGKVSECDSGKDDIER
ncbi:uncharacterized protein N7511_001447 [Penicillium nucicola]|uniref:uncharacterized protein n=1 Tax=Penicillium nucicola TaxID=1850975 RepID=UPI002545248B|nr:uncharacterized protein N7511_001447 [Penicillium nucicola]KAJ5776436.1 hypothetical protein N7511_001447 [Penicillium nucicola]